MRIRAFVCTGLGAIDTRRAVCLKGNLYAPEKKSSRSRQSARDGGFYSSSARCELTFYCFRTCVRVYAFCHASHAARTARSSGM